MSITAFRFLHVALMMEFPSVLRLTLVAFSLPIHPLMGFQVELTLPLVENINSKEFWKDMGECVLLGPVKVQLF